MVLPAVFTVIPQFRITVSVPLGLRAPRGYGTVFHYIKSDSLKIKAANSILKSRLDKALRLLSDRYGNYISSGSCRLCKPCRCRSGLPCGHPDKMSCSFEALGMDVGRLTESCLDHELLWYSKGNLPKYTSVAGGLLTNDKIDGNQIEKQFSGRL